jgi:RimJ/RimL family protein N-acetyltransferase
MYTERLKISLLDRKDIHEAKELFTDAGTRAYLGGTINEDTAIYKLKKWVARNQNDEAWYFTIRLKCGEFIGIVSIDDYIDTIYKDLSFQFLSKHWHQGYAYEAISNILIEIQRLLVKDVIAETQKDNNHSIRLLKKLGFKLVDEYERFNSKQCLFIIEKAFVGLN